MATHTDIREFIELENMLASRIKSGSAEALERAWRAVEQELAKGGFDKATALAENLSLAHVGTGMKSYAKVMFHSMIDFGARLAAQGNTLTASLPVDDIVDAQVRQLLTYMAYGYTSAAQDYLLQLIAQERGKVQKAAAVRSYVSYIDNSNARAQLIAGLHTSRLGGWGFVAEADMLGMITYKLSAQLDNRTSKFCRFIHGKTFTVESARPLLDVAVRLDDPEALKATHPWPNQSKAGMAAIQNMSNAQLQSAGYGVPPFHPGCRTLMVPVNYRTRIAKPPARQQQMSEYVSTMETFESLSIPITQEGLTIWNDYVKLNPATVISNFTGKAQKDLLGKSKRLLSVTEGGDIIATLGEGEAKLRFTTGTGDLTITGKDSIDFLLKKGGLQAVRAFAESVSATNIEVTATSGTALNLGLAGFVPTPEYWTGVKMQIAKLMETLDIPSEIQQTLDRVLLSPNPMKFKDLVEGVPEEFLHKVLDSLSFRATLSLDATGLS